jgi:drug/metabolite transporter (DMT)-like permease
MSPSDPNPATTPRRGGMLPQSFIAGAAWAVAAAGLYALVPVAVKLLSGHLPPIEIVFFRNALGLVFFVGFFAWRGFGSLRTARFSLHLQRNLCNFVGMWFWFAAIAMMPVAKAIALHFTEPLMAATLAMLFLGEKARASRWIAIGLGFAGVLIVLRPGVIPIGVPALMVLGSALLYAGVSVYTRFLGRTDAASTTTFYYQGMLTVFALPPALFVWVAPTLADVPALLLVAAAGTAAPYCLIRAFRYAEASALSPFGFLRLPITAGLAFILFDEPTEIWTWIGATLIFSAAYYNTQAERRAGQGR